MSVGRPDSREIKRRRNGEQHGRGDKSSKTGSRPDSSLWFDILGRVVPGAFLLVGLFLEDWQKSLTELVHKFAADFPLTSQSVGFFLLFTSASFFVGHFLGALSYLVPGLILDFLWPIKGSAQLPANVQLPLPPKSHIESISGENGPAEKHRWGSWPWLKSRNQKQKSLTKRNDILAHWLWTRNPQLAALMSRWGADALAGRSVALASAALLLAKWPHLSTNVTWLLAVLSFCGIRTYMHYRNKVASGAVYLSAMFDASPGGEQPSATR